MFSCERCEKQYAYLHKLKHHQLWSCKGQPSKTCMCSSPRRAGSRNCFTLPPTPEKGEADVEVGNGQKEGEEKTEEVATVTAVLVNEREENEEEENEDSEKVEEVWIYKYFRCFLIFLGI